MAPRNKVKTKLVSIRTTPWVWDRLEQLSKAPGPFAKSPTAIAEELLRQKVGEMFRGQWEPALLKPVASEEE